ncbi:MAG TPA: helix-turn-helix transcriptional regulator [Candidatus Rhabdochlamydia sp.]|nr:helix-turn-helix transcriptional regulator [Candidatus Rhabdochlamydia sp.]
MTDPVFRDSQNPFSHLETDEPISTLLPSVEEIIEKYRDLIFEHVSRRIAFFFQQLICCFQTKLHFEIGQVVSQGASAKKVILTDQNLASLEFERNAAHSSTLPCLLAYDLEEWELYQAKKTKLPKGWIFLKGTDSYRLWNSTINMPRWVNMVDLQIDGTSRDKKLRYETLHLINSAAQGEIDPEEGLELFIKLSLDQVESSYKTATQLMYQKILNLYKYELESTQVSFNHNRSMWLEALLSIRVSDESSRKIIYQIRYQAVRDAQLGQAELMQKIDLVKNKISSSYKKKPPYFEAAFRSLLIAETYTLRNRQRLEKMYNFSYFDFKARLSGTRLNIFDNTKIKLAEKYRPQIVALSKEIISDMQELRKKEALQRSQITKLLRHAKKWTQKQLAQKLSVSQSTVSRMENRHKLIALPIAEKLSLIFQVDAGLFMPHFFYD